MANLAKGTLTVSSIGGKVEINNTPINFILVNKKYMFYKEKNELYFEYDNIQGIVSPDKIEIIKEDAIGRRTISGSNSCAGARGRFVRCTSPVDGKSDLINLSRLWMLVYHLEYGHIALPDVDKYFLNHLDNKGNEEGANNTKDGIDRDNYEICTKEQNDRHGRVWHHIYNLTGRQLKFSAYDDKFMKLMEGCETKEEMEMILKMKGIIK